jgi:excisionase family DNA binding protein
LTRYEAIMRITIKQAATATGKSKPTILRAIKEGKISAVKDDMSGVWMIDPAELHRVFPPASRSENEALQSDADLLRREVTLLTTERERERTQLQGRIDDLTRRLDTSEQERREKDRQLTALLTDQSQQTRPKPRRWALPALIVIAVLVAVFLLATHWELVRSVFP